MRGPVLPYGFLNRERMVTDMELLAVIDEASEWLDIDGVQGIAPGTTDGEACIVVGCSLPPSELAGKIPTNFRGYPVIFEDWGIISAQKPE